MIDAKTLNIGDVLGNYTVIEFKNKKHTCIRLKSNLKNREVTTTISYIENGKFNIYNDYTQRDKNWKSKNRFEFYDDYVKGYSTANNLVFYLDYEQYNKLIESRKNVSDHALPKGKRFPVVFDGGRRKSLIAWLNTEYYGYFSNANNFDLRRKNLSAVPYLDDCNVFNRLRGVHFNNKYKKFVSTYWTEGMKGSKILGYFRDYGEAIKSRLTKEIELYGSLPEWKQRILESYDSF